MNEKLREKIFDLVTDPPCHQGHNYCEFWDVQGHYCWLKNMHPDSKKCGLLDQILALIKPVKLRRLSDEEITDINHPFGCEDTCQNESIGCEDCVKRMVALAQLDQVKKDNPDVEFEEGI